MTKNAITLNNSILDALKPTSWVHDKKLRHDAKDKNGDPQTCSTITDLGCKNLMVRTTASGKSWSFNLKVPALKIATKAKLGDYTLGKSEKVLMTLVDARRMADHYREEAKAGRDPRPAAVAAAAEAEADPDEVRTMDDLILHRWTHEVKGKLEHENKTLHQYKKYIGDAPYNGGRIGDVLVRDFEQAKHYRPCVKKLLAEGKTGMATTVRRHLYCLLGYAVNLVVGVHHNKMEGAKNEYEYEPRDRLFSDEELRAIWHGVRADFSDNPSVFLPLLLQMVLGQRIGEIAAMRKDNGTVDLDAGMWVITKHKTGRKTKRVHAVPLPPLAVRLLREAAELSKGSPVYFPQVKDRHKSVNSKYIGTELWRVRTETGVDVGGAEYWTSHAFRHTMASVMNELDIPGDVQSLILNHAFEGDGVKQGRDRNAQKGSKVTEIYSKSRQGKGFKHIDKKREALTKWAEWLEGTVNAPTGGNVVSLPVKVAA